MVMLVLAPTDDGSTIAMRTGSEKVPPGDDAIGCAMPSTLTSSRSRFSRLPSTVALRQVPCWPSHGSLPPPQPATTSTRQTSGRIMTFTLEPHGGNRLGTIARRAEHHADHHAGDDDGGDAAHHAPEPCLL